MEQDEIFMKEALREAHAALEDGEIPIGAVVVWKGRIRPWPQSDGKAA